MRGICTLLLSIAFLVLIFFGLSEYAKDMVLAILAGWTVGGMSRFIVNKAFGEE